MWDVVRVRSIVQLKNEGVGCCEGVVNCTAQESREVRAPGSFVSDYAHLTRSYLFDSEHKQLLYVWKFAENDVIEVHCYGADKGSN